MRCKMCCALVPRYKSYDAFDNKPPVLPAEVAVSGNSETGSLKVGR